MIQEEIESITKQMIMEKMRKSEAYASSPYFIQIKQEESD